MKLFKKTEEAELLAKVNEKTLQEVLDTDSEKDPELYKQRVEAAKTFAELSARQRSSKRDVLANVGKTVLSVLGGFALFAFADHCERRDSMPTNPSRTEGLKAVRNLNLFK